MAQRPNLAYLVLLGKKKATPICLCIANGCFYSTPAELSHCTKDHVTLKAEDTYDLEFSRKSLPTSSLELC